MGTEGPLVGIRILEVGTCWPGPTRPWCWPTSGPRSPRSSRPAATSPARSATPTSPASTAASGASASTWSPRRARSRLGQLAAGSHALLTNLRPSTIRAFGLTYDALRPWNERIVCVAITGFGLDGGDDPSFDHLIQAASGVASLTGDPDGPPMLPGYSSVDNSSGLTAALGLLAMIVSGRGGQVDVSLRDVMLSQLNYRAAAYLNDGAVPRRYPFGAHSYYVPAQLFPTAVRLSGAVHHPRPFWQLFAGEAGLAEAEIEAFATMVERAAHRDEVLAVVAKALAADTADRWEARLRPLGVPARSVRTLPEAFRGGPLIAAAGGYRLVGNPIRIDGYHPAYTTPPRLGQHGG